jgi:hypothetical protein
VKTAFTNLRAACSLGIIATFVLFLAASAPHRVHHLFENLPGEEQTARKGNHKRTSLLSPAALSQTSSHESDQERGSSPERAKNLANHRHRNHSLGGDHHHESVKDENGNPRQDRSSVTVDSRTDAPPLTESGIPLHADSPHNDAHHNPSAHTICLLQSAAKHSHLSATHSADLVLVYINVAKQPAEVRLQLLSLFNPSPFSQRAPPRV